MLLLIDNLDSFTYNISALFEELGEKVIVCRYDEIDEESCLALKPDAIVIGPGPGHPDKSVLSKKLLLSGLPILGICMGHQLIGLTFGGKVSRLKQVFHGKQSWIEHANDPLFSNIPSPFLAMRYHSLVIEELPKVLEAIAWSGSDVMAIRHRELPIVGMQFHPDSIGTEMGKRLIANYIEKSLPR